MRLMTSDLTKCMQSNPNQRGRTKRLKASASSTQLKTAIVIFIKKGSMDINPTMDYPVVAPWKPASNVNQEVTPSM